MSALVPELVNMASDPGVSTADLLRRALVVAHRLAVREIEDWIKLEINGYGDHELPDYRKLVGNAIPVPKKGESRATWRLDPADLAGLLQVVAEARVPHGVSVIEGMATTTHEFFVEKLPPHIDYLLQRPNIGNFSLARTTSPIQYRGILDAVKTRILEWALDLEKRGIIGEGLSFTPQEKKAVQEQHFHFGDVSGQVQINSNGSTQHQTNATGPDIASVKELIGALETVFERIRGPEADELRAELATLKAQVASPKPKWEIIKMAARSIKAVAEGAAGNILANLAQPHVVALTQLAVR